MLLTASPPSGDEDSAEERGTDDETEQAELAGGIGEVLVADQAVHCGPDERGNEQQDESGSGDGEVAASGAGGALPVEDTRRAKDYAASLSRDLTLMASIEASKRREQLMIGIRGMGRRDVCAGIVLDGRLASGRLDLLGRVHKNSHEAMSGRCAKEQNSVRASVRLEIRRMTGPVQAS